MCDVNILWAELARSALCDSAQTELGACECSVARAAPKTRSRTGEKDAAAASRDHVTGSFARRKESAVAAHLPHLAEHALGRFQQRKIYIRADVEDADFERRVSISVREEGDDFFFFARIERARDDLAARAFDVGDERRELVAAATAGEDREARSRKTARDGGADIVARADDGGSGVSLWHARAPARTGGSGTDYTTDPVCR